MALTYRDSHMQIFVKVCGKTIMLNVEFETTVVQLKTLLASHPDVCDEWAGGTPYSWYLAFGDVWLMKGGHTLESYGVGKDAALELLRQPSRAQGELWGFTFYDDLPEKEETEMKE